MIRLTLGLLCLGLCSGFVLADDGSPSGDAKRKAAKLTPGELTGTRNVHVAGDVMLAGQPSKEGFEELARRGFKKVITLRHPAEERFDEAAVCRELGLEFFRMPISSPDDIDAKLIERCCEILRDAEPESGVLLHCASATRVGAVWLAHRVKEDGLPVEKAREEARQVGLGVQVLEDKALEYLQQQ